MAASKLSEVDERNFARAVLGSALPVLVDFTAVWCPPCRVIVPHLEAVAARYQGRLVIVKCDADDNPALAARYDVRGLPTVVLLDQYGNTIWRHDGPLQRPDIELLERHIRQRLGR